MAKTHLTILSGSKSQSPPKKGASKKKGIPQKDREYFANVPPEQFQPEIVDLYLDMLEELDVLFKAVKRLQDFEDTANESAKKIFPKINNRLNYLEQFLFIRHAKKPLTREDNRDLAEHLSIDFDDMKAQISECSHEGAIQ